MTDTNYTPEEKTYTSSVKEQVKGMWPTSGNNTEARRSESPQSSPPTPGGGIRGNKGGTDPKTEKALSDAGA